MTAAALMARKGVYVCVYRSPTPNASYMRRMQASQVFPPELHEFLQEYQGDACFYDWGDDPAFFAAKHFLSDVRRASWGVCRHDLRARLTVGDLIVFFCAREERQHPGFWNYHYIGFGTVAGIIPSRSDIWSKARYAGYRSFYNLLVDRRGLHEETFLPLHHDWSKRIAAPYIIFDHSDEATDFNLDSPLHVATYRRGEELLENWLPGPLTERLQHLLLLAPHVKGRRLRTTHPAFAHRHLNLTGRVNPERLQQELAMISSAARNGCD